MQRFKHNVVSDLFSCLSPFTMRRASPVRSCPFSLRPRVNTWKWEGGNDSGRIVVRTHLISTKKKKTKQNREQLSNKTENPPIFQQNQVRKYPSGLRNTSRWGEIFDSHKACMASASVQEKAAGHLTNRRTRNPWNIQQVFPGKRSKLVLEQQLRGLCPLQLAGEYRPAVKPEWRAAVHPRELPNLISKGFLELGALPWGCCWEWD